MIIFGALIIVGILFAPLFLIGAGVAVNKQNEMKANEYLARKYDEENNKQ